MFRPLIKRLSHNHSRIMLNPQIFQLASTKTGSFKMIDGNLVEQPNSEQNEFFKGVYLHKQTNQLVECDSNIILEKPFVKETKIYINDNNLIHSQYKLLPVRIHYFDKNTICKITVEIINS